MSEYPLRFGMVGAGAIAQAYAQAFERSAIVELAAVADCNTEAGHAMAEATACVAFRSAEEMISEMDLDAAVVCTPPDSHGDVCAEFFARRVPVLCEKPLAIDSGVAEEMIAEAHDQDVVFTMASKFRYVPDVDQARSIIASGVIGEVVLFENVFTGRVDMTQRWNSDPHVSGGGVLIDNGTHSVDITRFFLGTLSEVQAMEGHRIQDLQVEDTAKLFVRSESDVLASIDLSWSVSKELPYYIAVYGSGGTLLVGWGESKYRRSNDEQWTVFGNGYDKCEAFRNQLENFAGAVVGEQSLVVTPEDALASVCVVEAAYRSLERGEWEPIERPPVATL